MALAVGMLVMREIVPVERQHVAQPMPEQSAKGRVARHLDRMAGTAHMPFDAQHAVGPRHDQMQVMADQQHGHSGIVAQPANQLVKLGLPGHVHTRQRLVEDEQVRPAQQRAGERDPVQFAAGQDMHRPVERIADANQRQHVREAASVPDPGETEKATNAQGQDGIHGEMLRDVTQPHGGRTDDRPGIGADQTEHHPHQGRFPGAVGADQRHDLPRRHGQIDMVEDQPPGTAQDDAVRADQRWGRSEACHRYCITLRCESWQLTSSGGLPPVRNRVLQRVQRASLAVAALVAMPAAVSAAPRVVASIPPVYALVGEVMAGVAVPVLLVPPGASPHGYQMRPSEAAALEQAQLVVWVGPDLETHLARPLASLAGGARQLQLSALPGITLLPAREGGVWAAHDHDQAHEHEHEHEHAQETAQDGDHEDAAAGNAPIDAHLWLSLANAEVIAGAVATVLAEIDPANAPAYAANAAALQAELRALAGELEVLLKPVRERPFVVAHDAWQYVEREFGLQAVGSITVSPDRPPSAQRLSELRSAVVARGATCVFAEPQYRSDLVEVLVQGTGARAGLLDPLGAAVWPEAGGRYVDLMRANAAALVACLSTAS